MESDHFQITMTAPLTQEQFAKVAAALMSQSRGETMTGTVPDRAQMLAFAQALVDGNTSDDEPPHEQVRVPQAAACSQLQALPSVSTNDTEDEEEEEAEIQRMLIEAHRNAAAADPSSGEEADDE